MTHHLPKACACGAACNSTHVTLDLANVTFSQDLTLRPPFAADSKCGEMWKTRRHLRSNNPIHSIPYTHHLLGLFINSGKRKNVEACPYSTRKTGSHRLSFSLNYQLVLQQYFTPTRLMLPSSIFLVSLWKFKSRPCVCS